MFVNFNADWPPPSEHPHPRPSPRINRRREKRLFQAIALNALLLVAAPIGGATIVSGILRWIE